ncbi:hypothetical protein ASPFODRAFT_708374 [Aspergillus luchuensis CBS 106.47]|uniref:Uncharacterized protein n=1 Tax=Aspergillus luchuensis (strain CBS 106.47) TaxID=1137211 RepID=A0A1M3T0H9_ASPLC|nr:hypothetical protein ASPFODRAFT_708374 [Aspergillus luchuensis CBS 106.47]
MTEVVVNTKSQPIEQFRSTKRGRVTPRKIGMEYPLTRERKFVMHNSSSSLRLREMERISVDVAVDYAEAFPLE